MARVAAAVDEGEPAGLPALVGSDRVLAVLTELAKYPSGAALDQLARALDAPKPTVHRALMALRRAGFATQQGRGAYQLGDEFLRLAFTHHAARPDHLHVHPVLQQLAERYGETAHYAVLDGRSVVYRAKVNPSVGAATLTSTIGGRNPAHCTAVGKLLLSYQLPDESAVARWIAQAPLAARTPQTMTTATQLNAELCLIRARGYSTDDQENEPGVNCLALPVFFDSPAVPTGAVSVSALTYRTPLPTLLTHLDTIRSIVERRA